MPARDLAIEFDVDSFNTAIDMTEEEIHAADVEECLNNAKRQLYLAVQGFGYRTGNLRSSATDVWRALGMQGRPMTNLKPGVKFATYRRTDTGKTRTVRLDSWGRYEDRTNLKDPEFKYELYAAEWRERRSRASLFDLMNRAVRDGMLSRSEVSYLRKLTRSWGGGYDELYQRMMELLGERGAFLRYDFSGQWKPYSIYKRGARAVVTAGNFQFRYAHAKALQKHSAKGV